ncbi:prepilin-type N-terminal cleavage/methylation domain-containing protein [Candidatus Uhrbacteria bacterium]|nr:prepilin-type N-terminal cleavage/methylation domain-containing protein [Candidatus Uhrbacteria bacterium]
MKSRETSRDNGRGGTGFTLIELLVVLTIFLLLIVGSISLFRSTQVSAHLNEQSNALIHALRSADIESLYGRHNNSHGLYFTAAPGGEEQIIRYTGTSYAGRVAGSEITYTFPSSIDLSLQLSTTTPEIVFARNTGVPSATGTILLDLAGIGSRTISVNRLGAVDEVD